MIVIPRRAATAFVGTVVVVLLLFGFKTPDQSIGRTTGGSAGVVADGGTTPGSSGSTGSSDSTGSSATPAATPAPSAASGSTQVTGPTVSTRFGPVQVQVTVSDGKITEITALQLPSGGRSGRISEVAEPILHDEALSAQSAQIDTVSGATYTSDAYEQSLQAALDKARALTRMTRRVEAVMGTAVSLDLRDPDVPIQAVDAVFDHLREVDARFSTYRLDSEISRLARGELEPSAASPDVRHVLAVCEQLGRDSGGAFDAGRAGRDRRLDPSGYVKGWAVEEAAWQLDDAGAHDYLINAGGDVVARGEPAPGQRWRVGIRHPDQPDKVAAVLAVGDGAVATSGTYERGDHIVDPRTGRPVRGLRSLTVVGPRLGFVDAYATAAFVMGMDGLRWVATHPGHEALAITDDDRVIWTEGLARYLVSGTGAAAGLA